MSYTRRRFLSLVALCAFQACGSDTTGPSNQPPAHLDAVADLSRTAAVGTAVSGGIVVKVTDAGGRPVQGATVALAVTLGNGSTNPRLATSDAKGQATATWTLGTIVGPNEVTATVSGVGTTVKFSATGTAGPVTAISISPQSARLLPAADTTRITAQSLDAFGNIATPKPTLTPRDPSLISVDASGLVRALRRGAATYVVAAAGSKIDSILVTVLASGQSICTGAANPLELGVGQVITNVSGAGLCVHATTAGAEYAIVPFYDSGVPSATTQVEVRGQGLVPLSIPAATIFSSRALRSVEPGLVPDDAFESALRARERAEVPKRIESARSWMQARRNVVAAATQAAAVPAVGDLLNLNVNSRDFCQNPDIRTGRVAAVTDKAVVVSDTANPPGGFSDAEYRSIGVTFDTLIDPVDRGAFGAVTDVDNNGHVILFFTRAVNEATPAGASSVVLGFFYQRDLFPKTASPGPCLGSNVAEMFYLLVPDPTGVVNSNKRSTAQVLTLSNGTVAHEYQHLINASRRMYVNNAGTSQEEKWLDEGLSHVAEELNFFQAAGRAPRANIDAGGFSDPRFVTAYSTFEVNNFNRYKSYLARPELQSPIGIDAFDDDLPTRGAIWNFLRYAADHLPLGQENAFWQALANSKSSGVTNLMAALGAPTGPVVRDWAISVFMDDNAPNVDLRFQQPSWNLRSALTNGGTSLAFPLSTRTLIDNTLSSTTLGGNGIAFYRFSVASGQDALLTVTSGNQPVGSAIQLAVVRVR